MNRRFAFVAGILAVSLSPAAFADGARARQDFPAVYQEAMRAAEAANKIVAAGLQRRKQLQARGWSSAFALRAVRQLGIAAVNLSMRALRTTKLAVHRAYRRFETRFAQASRVFTQLQPTPAMVSLFRQIGRHRQTIAVAMEAIRGALPGSGVARAEGPVDVKIRVPFFPPRTWAPRPGVEP